MLSRVSTLSLFCAAILALMEPFSAIAQDAPADAKPVIRTEAELPRFTYALPTETASELLTNKEAFDEVMTVVKTDIDCKNGVVHVIDAVIMPK